jgi:triacylglycerol lipase
MTSEKGWQAAFDPNDTPAGHLPMWRECFLALEAAMLHIAPIYWGFGAPHGDESGVVLIPGFLGTDTLMVELYAWLYRMDYRPYFSGIGVNAECPNLLIKGSLNATIDRARRETGRKVHLVGHSLGGMIAIALAAQRPNDIASVVTLAAPFRGKAAHPNILRMAEFVRGAIHARHGDGVLPACYTGHCMCNFVDSLANAKSEAVPLSALYTKTDAIVDWQYCITGDPERDFETPGTHIGMIFNPSVYAMIAKRLASVASKR